MLEYQKRIIKNMQTWRFLTLWARFFCLLVFTAMITAFFIDEWLAFRAFLALLSLMCFAYYSETKREFWFRRLPTDQLKET